MQPIARPNLRLFERIIDACHMAELQADIYGDPYTVIEINGGFSTVRTADLPLFGLDPWQVHGQRTSDPDSPRSKRRRTQNSALVLATSFNEVGP